MNFAYKTANLIAMSQVETMFKTTTLYADLIEKMKVIDSEMVGSLDCSFLGKEIDTLLGLLKLSYISENRAFMIELFFFLIIGFVYILVLPPVVLRYETRFDYSQYAAVVTTIN